MSKTKSKPETAPQEETGGDCPSAPCSPSWFVNGAEYRERDGWVEARNHLNPEWVIVDKAEKNNMSYELESMVMRHEEQLEKIQSEQDKKGHEGDINRRLYETECKDHAFMRKTLERVIGERDSEKALADGFANSLMHEAGTGDVLPLSIAYDAWKAARNPSQENKLLSNPCQDTEKN